MINSGREWDWMDSQINKLNQMKIRTEIDNVKQQLIDDLIKSFNANPEIVARKIIFDRFVKADLSYNYDWLQAEVEHYRDNTDWKEYQEAKDLYFDALNNITKIYFKDGE